MRQEELKPKVAKRLGVRAACRRFCWVSGLRMRKDSAEPFAACQKRCRVTALQDAVARMLGPSPIGIDLELIIHMHLVAFESIDRLHHGRPCVLLEPSGGTPRILAGHGHQSVLHRVAMRVAKPGKVGPLKRQSRLVVVVPNFPTWRPIQSIDPANRLGMEL